jgi:cytochrome c oxidase assembly protein subunit 15
LQLLVAPDKKIRSDSLRKLTWWIIVVLVIQLIYGGLMAGHKAATAAPTWPDINGSIIPENMFRSPDGLLNLIENKITIHFIHRTLAYIILVLILVWTWEALKLKGSPLFLKTRTIPFFTTITQIALGICTVLLSLKIVPNQWGVFEWMAQLHQLVAMLLLLSLTGMAYLLKSK